MNTENKIRTLEKEVVQDQANKNSLRECRKEYSGLVERLRSHKYQSYLLTRTHNEEGNAARMLAKLASAALPAS